MKILFAILAALAALTLAGCGKPGAYQPAFALEVRGDLSAPVTVEFHTASGMAITRPNADAATGEGDVNLGVPDGIPGSDAVDLIRSGLPSNL